MVGYCSKFINAVQAVALSRSHIQHHIVKPDPNCWPGLIEITSMLASMDPKQEQLLPFSFHAVKIFHDLLTKIITSKDQYYREDDLKMMDALLLAKAHTLSHFTIDSKEGDLIQLAAQANAAVSQQIKKYPKLFTKKLKDNNESLTAAGHLEKVSISLDMEIEQNGGQLQGSELRKAVLQGDVMVDLVEQILR